MRETVGHVRLVGVQAYHQLREVYRALRLVVNCLQPSLKLQAKVPKGEQIRRVYDAAQTPLQRLLASGVLLETRQRELRGRVEQVDPLALSEHLDVLRHSLLRGAHTTAADGEGEFVLPLLRFSLLACTSEPLPVPEEGLAQVVHQEESVSRDEILNWSRTTHDPFAGAWEELLALVKAHPEWSSTQILQEIGHQAPERTVSVPIGALIHGLGTIRPHLRANWEEPWPPELIQGDHSEPHPMEPHLPKEAVVEASQPSAQAQPIPAPVSGTSSSTTGSTRAVILP